MNRDWEEVIQIQKNDSLQLKEVNRREVLKKLQFGEEIVSFSAYLIRSKAVLSG